MTPRSLFLAALLFATPVLAAGESSQSEPSATPAIIVDPEGSVGGIPFGSPEQEVIEKLGPPTGTLRLNDQRSALIYGRSLALFFYDGQFDAVRLDQHLYTFTVSQWLPSQPQFAYANWTLANGLKEGMTSSEVSELLKIPILPDDRFVALVPLARTNLELNFSKGSTWTVRSYLIARRHGDTDHWTQTSIKRANHPLKGKMVIGMGTFATKKGIRVTTLMKGGPGHLAGLEYGDLIEKIDGRPTVGLSAAEFDRIIEEKDPHELTIIPRDEGPSRVVSVTKVEGSSLEGMMIGRSDGLLQVSVGEEAPDFEAVSPDGRKVRLSDLRGQLVLLNFTATWCAPGRMETPRLKTAYDAFHHQGFIIVSVYLDRQDKEPMISAQKLGVTWPIRIDGPQRTSEVAQSYGVSAIPTNILIGPDGQILNVDVAPEILDQIIPRALSSSPTGEKTEKSTD